MNETAANRMHEIKEIISDILEIDPEEITPTSYFKEDHEADSLRAIEIMARLEKKFGIEIPQNDLSKMTNLTNVYDVLSSHAGWSE